MALPGFYHDSSHDKSNMLERMTTGIVWERVHVTGVPERIEALKIFGRILVWALAACMALCYAPRGDDMKVSKN